MSIKPGMSYNQLKEVDGSKGGVEHTDLIGKVGMIFLPPSSAPVPPVTQPVDTSDKSRLETVEPKVASFRDRLKGIRKMLMSEMKG